jgi:hypothetical protein
MFNARLDDNNNQKKKDFKKQDEDNLKKAIDEYLKGLDTRYAIQNPIPGKRQIILSREVEVKKRTFAYIQEQIDKGASRQELLKILNDDWGQSGTHKTNINNIEKKID